MLCYTDHIKAIADDEGNCKDTNAHTYIHMYIVVTETVIHFYHLSPFASDGFRFSPFQMDERDMAKPEKH